MLLSATAVGTVTEILDAAHFYRDRHAASTAPCWRSGRRASRSTRSPSPTSSTSAASSSRSAAGRRSPSSRRSSRRPRTSSTTPASSRRWRRCAGSCRPASRDRAAGPGRPGETADLVDRAEQIVFELAQQRVASDFAHIEALLKESFERITHLYEAGAEITGVPTGFRELDKLTSGFQPGNLIILAARPSMGKSALALCTAANLGVRHEIPVALFTLEMSKAEVTQRLMCSRGEGRVTATPLRPARPGRWPRLTAACDKLMKAPIYVDDTGSITMMELRSKARRLKSREPSLGLVIVDYLQLMTTGAIVENPVQEVSQISRQLKVLARDLDVPILALSQLSRAVEQRHDKRPILSDLRESGCLAGESRVFLPEEGVYRPIRELVGQNRLRRARPERGDVATRAPTGASYVRDRHEAGLPIADAPRSRDPGDGESPVPIIRRVAPPGRAAARRSACAPASDSTTGRPRSGR